VSTTIIWRERCRRVFDLLWRGENPLMDRAAAYAWLARTLGTTEPKLGSMDVPTCVRVMRATKGLLQANHRVGAQIDEALASAGLE
jgi:hypothetical protein